MRIRLKEIKLAETVEHGLGAAHRGVILGCDGSNRYTAALYMMQWKRPLFKDEGKLKWYHGSTSRL